jgi:predicted alternative tryptophan synthase beta-subunit
MENQNISMVRGDTLAFNVEVTDETGAAVTVDSAFFTCKKNPALMAYALQKSLEDGIEQEGKLLTVRVAPEDTENLDVGNYYYDFQIGVENDKFTPLIGMLTLQQNVTE